MFAETVTSDRETWQAFTKGTRLTSDPPETLVLSVAWDAGDDRVTVLNVWDSGEAIADFYVQRTRAVVEQRGEPTDKPKRHGQPLEVYVRP